MSAVGCRVMGTLFLASLVWAQPARAAAMSCEDARLNKMLKAELDVRAVETKCGLSDVSGSEKVSITTRDGKTASLSCCAAVRIQMLEISELQLEAKRQACGQAQAVAAGQECRGKDCLANNVSLLSGVRARYRGLISNAREAARKTGKECEPILRKFQEKVAGDAEQIRRAVANARTPAEKEAILLSSGLDAK